MSHRIQQFASAALLAFGLAVMALPASAGERVGTQLNLKDELDGKALGFGIQGETFHALPIDAGTLPDPTQGPDVKLDEAESPSAPAGE